MSNVLYISTYSILQGFQVNYLRMNQVSKTLMKEFVESYGLNYIEFRQILTKENMMIAGSTTLSLYLKQESIDTEFTSNDLDVWVYYNSHSQEVIKNWMKNNNYYKTPNYNGSNYKRMNTYKNMINIKNNYKNININYIKNMIKNVIEYKNASGNIIQIIYVDNANLKKYYTEYFDINYKIWWNATTELFETDKPELIKN